MDYVIYQLQMEQFYYDLAKMFKEKNWQVLSDSEGSEKMHRAHMLLFNQILCEDAWHAKTKAATLWFLKRKDFTITTVYDPAGSSDFVELLASMKSKGYNIIMNFYAEDVVLGNVAVEIHNKWFAFGQCMNSEPDGLFVSEIWPLRYVLPKVKEMQMEPRFMIPLIQPESNENCIRLNSGGCQYGM